jgi:hypothetical protein
VKNPDAEIPRKYKMKEHHMRDALLEQFPELTMVFDKKIDEGCSRRRPDVRVEMYTHTIVVECDENRHAGASYACENKRTMEIFQDLGNRPLVLIRFNPDKYDEVPSCFVDGKMNRKEWNRRIKLLKQTIEAHKEVPEKEITVEYLFYGDEARDSDSDSDSE